MEANESRKNPQLSRSSVIALLLALVATLAAVLTAAGCSKTQDQPLLVASKKPAADSYKGITKGPVLLRVSQNRAALMWETDIEGQGKVLYGRGQELTKQSVTRPIRIDYQTEQRNAPAKENTVFIHKVWLEGLEPGELYSYRVVSSPAQSRIYKFRTTQTNTDEVRFIVYGDSRTNPQRHRRLIQQMIKAKVDFVVNTGDLVTSGNDYGQWGPQFFEPLKGLAESVPVYIAKGNHDGKIGIFEKLLIPDGRQNNYSFSYGPVHYYCADNSSRRNRVQLPGLIVKDLSGASEPWKFVSYHVPSLNFGGHWSRWGGPSIFGELARAGADFVITGHSHQYERFRPVIPPAGTGGNFVTYITSGGGGGPLYDIEPGSYHAYADKIHHFCLFHIKAGRLTMDAIDIKGKVVDHLEITKTDGRLNKRYLETAIPLEAIRLHQNLHSALAAPLSVQPRKDEPFTVTYKVSVPASGKPVKMKFEFRSEQDTYRVPEPKVVVIDKAGGNISVELTATVLAEVKIKGIWPVATVRGLWIDCNYEIGEIHGYISQPVTVKSKTQRH